MRKRLISLLMVLVLVASGVVADSSVDEYIGWEKEVLAEGETFEVEFPYPVDPSSIMTPDGIEYVGYDSGIHTFRATKDVENVKGELFYRESGDVTEKDGEATNNGEVGTEGSGHAQWDSYQFGKIQWSDGDTFIYTIRFEASDFNEVDQILVKDIPNAELHYVSEPSLVAYYRNDADVYIGAPDEIEADIKYEDKGFEITFSPTGHDVYEINYTVDKVENLTNGYIIRQGNRIVESGGEIDWDEVPEPEPDEGTCPVCPIPNECDNSDLIDKIKDLEEQVRDKDDTIRDLEDKIKELENAEPIIKEVQVPYYYTELKIKEVIKEVVKETKVPHYITEVRFEEIIKEVEKEIQVPYYITEVRFKEVIKEVEVPHYSTEIIFEKVVEEVQVPHYITEVRFEEILVEVIKEVDVPRYVTEVEYVEIVKGCIEEKIQEENEEDTVEVLGESTKNETIVEDITVEDGEDEVILDDEPAVVEREEEDGKEQSNNNIHDNVHSDTVGGSDREPLEDSGVIEQSKLPATGEGKKTLYILIGVVLIIYGLGLKRRK